MLVDPSVTEDILKIKYFFPVIDYRLEDLYDWSNSKDENETYSPRKVGPKNLQRYNSRSGSLVKLNGVELALFRLGNRVYGIEEKCPHAGGPMHIGDIEVLTDKTICVHCPWHQWCFDVNTGLVLWPPKRFETIHTFPVITKLDGSLWIGFNEFDSHCFTDENF